MINSVYGIGNAVLGIITNSMWMITISAYYIIISIMRFSVMLCNGENELFVKRFSGYMFFVLDTVLIITTYLTITQNTGTKYNEIIMISVATYTFTKITLAAVNLCKSRKYNSPVLTTIRNISFADAAVSVFSLQRSMLVSFGDMSITDIKLFNTLTGVGVCVIVAVLGINLIRREKTKMAKAKLIKANEKIADGVKMGYKKIEDGVVGGYKKIEDAFVERYLTRDGETIEEAKERIRRSK